MPPKALIGLCRLEWCKVQKEMWDPMEIAVCRLENQQSITDRDQEYGVGNYLKSPSTIQSPGMVH